MRMLFAPEKGEELVSSWKNAVQESLSLDW